MSKMSSEEYEALVSGEKSDTDVIIDRKVKAEDELKEIQSAHDLLLGRSNKKTVVHFDECDIEIRTNLSRKSIKNLEFLSMWTKIMSGDLDAKVLDEAEGVEALAEFLEFITTDPELTKEFWISDDLDVSISQTIIQEFLYAQSKEGERIKNFRKD